MAEKTDDLLISISTDLATVRRSLKRLESDISSTTNTVQKQFDGLGKGIDKSLTTAMQARINGMVGIGVKATKEWTGALANQGAELERLRSRFNPVFSTITRYKTTVSEIQQAHRLGAISADEMTAAIGRERQAALASIAAIKGRNAELADTPRPAHGGVGAFQTSNIAAQFQDIAVTTAMGMSPLQIALQQGTQLSAVLGPMGASGAVKGLAAAFASVLNPVSLLTIGVIAAGAAAVQYFTDAGEEAASLDDILNRHEKNIQKLGPAYEAAKQKAKEYATDPSVVNALLSDDMKKAQAKLKEEIGNTLKAIEAELLQFAAKNNGSLLGNRFAGAEGLISSLRDGKIAVSEFLKQATALEKAGKISPEAATALRGYAAGADEVARAISGMSPKIDEVANSFGRMQTAIDRTGTGVLREEFSRLKKDAEDGRLTLVSLARALADMSGAQPDMSGAIAEFGNLAEAAIKAKNAIGQVTLAQGLAGDFSKDAAGKSGRLSPLTEDEKKAVMDRQQQIYNQQIEFFKRTGEVEKAFGISSKKLPKEKKAAVDRDANAYRDLVKSANDRIQQMQLEEKLIGKTGVAADAYRMRLDLLQKATDKGRELSPAHRAELERLAEAYGKVAERVAAARVQEDLLFERQQMFRSPTEQRVYDQLRSSGVDPSSAQGQLLAGQIRINEQLAISKDLAMDFASGFVDDLLSGVNAMDALANAAKRLGARLLDMALNQAINGLFGNLMSGIGGGTSFNPTPGGFAQMLGIPGYAKGTSNHPGGLAIVGERGPELLNLPKGSQVIPRIPQIGGGGAGGSIVVNFSPSIDNRGASAEAVARNERQMIEMRAELPSLVIQAVREAQSTRQL